MIAQKSCYRLILSATLLLQATQWLAAQDRSQVRRGQYLVAISACETCHTPADQTTSAHKVRRLSGGNTFSGIKVPNITPDPETGIGAWTDRQIILALRSSYAQDSTAAPVPIHSYGELSDSDAEAITIYLRSLTLIENRIDRTPKTLTTEASRSTETITGPNRANRLEYGAYVATVTGCLRCHSPAVNGVTDLTRAGMGGIAYSVKDGVWIAAPDITLKSRSGNWSHSELKRAITRGVRPDGSRLSGVMPFDAFDQITESDQDAVVSFIRSLKSQ